MKLYNKTQYPDSLLERLLTEAGKAVGARTTGVIVVATSTKPGYHHCKEEGRVEKESEGY